MRLMIASDIHGSALYCEKMLDAYKREQADRLLLLGDLLYHGPRNDLPDGYAPKKVIALLNAVRDELLCVRGNCEAEVDQMVLDFPVLADYCLLSVDGIDVFATHGHHHSFDSLPPMKRGGVFVQGHTHIPKCLERDGILCLNPGSVSIPKEGSEHSYMIYENRRFEWKSLDGRVYMEHTL